jgi:LmbE family N-acetylglucosaminyl deacetylase
MMANSAPKQADASVVMPPGVDSLVVVVPHPDDESLSTGVLLAHAAAHGPATTVIAVTDGESAYDDRPDAELARRRQREQVAALAQLGHTEDRIVRLGLRDGAVSEGERELAAEIAGRLTATTLLVAPSPYDWHPDHEACGRAAAVASSQFGCHRWSSLFWALHHPERLVASRPRILRLRATHEQVRQRRRAVECHRSQLSRSGGDPVLPEQLLSHLGQPSEWYVVER